MKAIDAAESAFRNGYEKGYEEGLKKAGVVFCKDCVYSRDFRPTCYQCAVNKLYVPADPDGFCFKGRRND